MRKKTNLIKGSIVIDANINTSRRKLIKIIFFIILFIYTIIFGIFISSILFSIDIVYSKELKKEIYNFLKNKEIEILGVKVIIIGFSDEGVPYINLGYYNEYTSGGVLDLQIENYKVSVQDIILVRETKKRVTTRGADGRTRQELRTISETVFNGSMIKMINNSDIKYFKTDKPILRFSLYNKIDKNYLFKNLITSFKNLFDTINIKYSYNNTIKINENLDDLLDSLEKIRKQRIYNQLSGLINVFLIGVLIILIFFSIPYFLIKD